MKNTVKISGVAFGGQVTTDNGTQLQLVSINIVEGIPAFRIVDGEKKLVTSHQLSVRMGEFTRLLALDENLALVEESELTDEEKRLSQQEQLTKRFKFQMQVLRGAQLTFSREEMFEVQEEDDDTDDAAEGAADANAKPKTDKIVVGYKDLTFDKLILSNAAIKLIEKKLGF